MKKFIVILLVAAILMTVVACQSQENDKKPSDPSSEPPVTTTTAKTYESLQARLESIVDASGVEGIRMGRNYRQIDKESVSFFIGTESFNTPFKECVALEPDINVDAFVLGLFELEEGEDVMAFAKEVMDKADLNKWVCVSAEAKYVAISGPYVLFVMTSKADIAKIADAAGFEPIEG